MAHSIPYRLGVFVRRHPFVPLAAVVLLLLYLTLDGRNAPPPPAPLPVAAPAGPPPCSTGLAEQMASAKQLLAAKQPTAAFDLLLPCSEAHRAGPDAAAYQKIMDQWQQAVAAQVKRDEQADRARKKREGVLIGMSPDDVLASAWGKPDKINRSTNKYGTSEQWVYRNRVEGYLYFENDVLTAIQN